MLFTCLRCRYTFTSPDTPSFCPDCGHTKVLPANDIEFDRFYQEKLTSLLEQYAPDMTTDERNWISILRLLNTPRASFYTAFHFRHYVLEAEPAMRLDTYKAFRWEFSRLVKQDRIALQMEGVEEPSHLLRDEKGMSLVKGWEYYGAALRTLYGFELNDPHKVPNLRSINSIDLKVIAETPSTAYEQFLWAWIEAVKDIPSPMEDMIPKMGPLLRVIKGGKKP